MKTKNLEDPSVVDDFMYGNNVASAHVYIRMGFLRKVFGIVSAQLLMTLLVGSVCMISEPIKKTVQQNQWCLLIAAIGSFGLLFALMVYRTQTPINYYLLALFTIFEAYTVGVVVTFYDVDTVLQAVFLTSGVTVGLTLYSLQTKRDFSSWAAGLYAALWVLIIGGIMQLFIQSPMMHLGMSIGGALLFSLFIIFDVQMIMTKLSPEEYIIGAINLYLDIINLFLYILRILGDSRK